MARVVKEKEYEARRNEILDAALRLIYTKGFDQMTIQDILDTAKISKGAFYHYFDSKMDVEAALIERMATEEVLPRLDAIVKNPNLTALEKLHGYFDISARWKTERLDMILSLLRVWYSDENILFREKLFDYAIKQVTPMLGEIVRQGIREGVFDTPYPDQIGQVIMYILQGLSDTFISLLLNTEHREWSDPLVIGTITEYVAALSDALERVLGAPKGSIKPVDPELLKVWFIPSNGKTGAVELKNGKEHQQ
jgi:AcrR family transcriptional regulator